MPVAIDDFLLVVVSSANAGIAFSNETTVDSGEAFSLTFAYTGGLNPAATAFALHWYANTSHRAAQGVNVSPGPSALVGAQAPSNISFDPTTPLAGAILRTGTVHGVAPTLGGNESRRNIYARAAIDQAALN